MTFLSRLLITASLCVADSLFISAACTETGAPPPPPPPPVSSHVDPTSAPKPLPRMQSNPVPFNGHHDNTDVATSAPALHACAIEYPRSTAPLPSPRLPVWAVVVAAVCAVAVPALLGLLAYRIVHRPREASVDVPWV